MPYCANCGKEFTSGAVFCPYCGTAVVAAAVPTASTPKITTTTAKYADLVQRIVAAIIDGMIMGMAIATLSVILMFTGLGVSRSSGLWHVSPSAWAWAPWGWLIGLLVPVVYYTYLEGTRGQTIGKKVMNIKVVKTDGGPCDLASAFLRNILRFVDGLAIGLVGIIVISVTKRRQRIGDIVANTVVMKV